MTRLLIDLTHTSHTRAQTGIQRLSRSLYAGLVGRGEDLLPLTHDPYESAWRPLRGWEQRNVAPPPGTMAGARGARWPLSARISGRLRRWLAARANPRHEPAISGGAFIEPEIFSLAVGRALPRLFAGISGPRVALFHDATALRLPELSPAKTVARYPVFMQELLLFDGVAAISEDSRAALVDYWRWLGIANPPPVIGLPLGIDSPPPAPYGHTVAPKASPMILSVGSIEGRKNHLALLDASERLWQRGLRFELRLIGLGHPQTGRAALERLRALQAAGRALYYEGPATETDLQNAYHACIFTVYPSLMEGFGLPVLESLSYGKPCICSAHSALGESARGGGCLVLDRVDAPDLAEAMASLLSDPDRLGRLADDARSRTFKTWSAYAGELVAWMDKLPRRNP
jgi:glycosyltransferase involved in cell wall biosynthesis